MELALPPALEVSGGYLWSLAYDPGETTGWAVYRVPRVRLLESGFMEAMRPGYGGTWAAGEFRGSEDCMVDQMVDLARCVYGMVDEDFGDEWTILVEDFVVRMISMKRSFLSPVRIGAAFRREMRNAPVFIDFQFSSDAMNVVTDGRLRSWNQYRPGSVHARDAQRHAILACRRYCADGRFRARVKLRMTAEIRSSSAAS